MKTDMQILLAGARSLVKSAAPRPTSADLGLDMDSIGGGLADYTSTAWGGSRAGRASHLSDAMGMPEPGMTIRHPITTDLLHTLTGGGLGALAGGGLGYLGAKLTGNPNPGDTAAAGALGGGALGGLTGLMGGRADRRDKMREIADEYDTGAPVDPSIRPKGVHAGLTAMMTPFGGAHRSGQTDVYEALNNKGSGPGGDTVRNGIIRNLSNILSLDPYGRMAAGTGQTLNSALRASSVDNKRRLQAKQQRTQSHDGGTQKTAADTGMLQQLLDGGRSLVSKVDLKNPVHTGAIGAGVGALGGLASGAMSDEEEPGYLQRALMGGVAGGGIGAGAGMLNQQRKQMQPPGQIAVATPHQDRTQPRLPPAEPLNIPRAPAPAPVPATTATAAAASTARPASNMTDIRKRHQDARDSINRYRGQPAPVLATAD